MVYYPQHRNLSTVTTKDQQEDTTMSGVRAITRPIGLGVKVAQTKAEQEACFAIRANVYGSRGWECPDVHGRETDRWDERSQHILVGRGGTYFATARVILSGGPDHPDLPFTENVSWWKNLRIDWGSTGEISRVAKNTAALRDLDKTDRVMVLSYLLKGIAEVHRRYQFSHFVFLVEEWLMKQLHQNGIPSESAGPPIEYHGVRYPRYFEVGDKCSNVPDGWKRFLLSVD